jgi:hypothetical protein
MQPKTLQVHMRNGRSRVKRRQNIAKLTGVLRVYAAWVVLLKKSS